MGQILYALDVPEAGGDTIFVNMYRAYEALSNTMKDLLSDMKAVHTGQRSYGASNSQVTLRQENFSKSMDVKVKEDAEEKWSINRPHASRDRTQIAVYQRHIRSAFQQHDQRRAVRFCDF